MVYSLFIGRWQPFHEGHQALIRRVIEEGKNVCIAIRDTEISSSNPFTAEERKAEIERVFPTAKVIVIPDIEEICYGRQVGWGIREIRLDSETEAISGTQKRKEMGIS